ncbi:hypothetical protein GJ744_001047 [Endocarpon pusillum]|uniref:Uncharacterized protein n=1 Tax=Endocarpon pusillum TaxID=364733 RepID=A0A8H7DZT2_9EURO|nr:hypothetical protein GJ744_001047 [Endocarpon pusillum]
MPNTSKPPTGLLEPITVEPNNFKGDLVTSNQRPAAQSQELGMESEPKHRRGGGWCVKPGTSERLQGVNTSKERPWSP